MDDRDTQLALSNEEVLTTLLRSTVFVFGAAVLSSISSVSTILTWFTMSPYSLLSMKPDAVAPFPSPLIVIVGTVVYPLPPRYPLKSTIVIVTT